MSLVSENNSLGDSSLETRCKMTEPIALGSANRVPTLARGLVVRDDNNARTRRKSVVNFHELGRKGERSIIDVVQEQAHGFWRHLVEHELFELGDSNGRDPIDV